MTAAASGWVDRNLGRLTMVCVTGTCLCLAGLAVLNAQVRDQAARGAQARLQQCESRPIAVQEQRWFHASGVISGKELDTILHALPTAAECAALLKER